MPMKKILFLLSLVIVTLAPIKNTFAEEILPQPDNKFLQKMMPPKPDWVKLLKLDDVQKEQFKAIQAESQPQIQAIIQQIATLRQQMDNIRADDEKKLQSILNENQQVKFNKIKTRMAKQHRKPQPREERKKRFKMGEM
jgi:hypothetical protein